MSLQSLPPDFFERDPHDVARDLLGHDLVRRRGDGSLLRGRIVELEVYGGRYDPASHSSEGPPTERNRAMFGDPGTAYVYLIYGIYYCFNIVTLRQERPSALLVRAARPLEGHQKMAEARGLTTADETDGWDDRNLMSGPGKLCQALDIDRRFDESALDSGELVVVEGEPVGSDDTRSIDTTPRIGLNPETVGKSAEWEWRYVVAESDYSSR